MPLPVCGHDEDDCEFDSDCVKWDCDPTPSCRGPSCRSGNDYYECVADLKTGSRTKTCTVYTDDDEYEADKTISQCGCRCYPDLGLVEELKETLELVYDGLKQTEKTLREQKDALWKQLEAHRKSDELKARVADLRGGDSSYDVLSRLDVKYVKYDTGWKGWEQYVPGGFMQRNEGVCGDSMESVVLYTAQIAAASLATFFSCGLASPLLQYAIDFFPLIIESEVSFELTETLVDDGNRMILTNLASTGDRLGEPGDGRLFTYAPFEFEIYKKHKFNLGSVSGNRVIVYLYLPAVEGHINRAIEGLSSCSGEACE